MNVYIIPTSSIETNTYIVVNQNKAFVVDPGGSVNKIIEILKSKNCYLEAILITHAHFDHILGVAELKRKGGVWNEEFMAASQNVDNQVEKNSVDKKSKDFVGRFASHIVESTCSSYDPHIFLHKLELDKIATFKNLAVSCGESVEKFVPDVLLTGGEKLSVAGLKIDIIHTPGHSAGGVCYVVENKIFAGDTIFYMSYGRTDFYDGNFVVLKNSIINKLFNLKGEYIIYPGHGDETSLSFEKKNNMILH